MSAIPLVLCHLLKVSAAPLLQCISHSFCHLLFPPPCPFFLPFLSCYFFFFLLCSSGRSLFLLHPPPAPSSAHVDTSTVAFDVDPLDLDAEEPPDFQGEPRSPKSMSGSVTSPQANAHRLPFFKKVTPAGPPRDACSPAALCPPAPLRCVQV